MHRIYSTALFYASYYLRLYSGVWSVSSLHSHNLALRITLYIVGNYVRHILGYSDEKFLFVSCTMIRKQEKERGHYDIF